jgi:cytochrome c553
MRLLIAEQPWMLAFALALSVQASDAFADKRAGEKKAQLCLLCHRVDSTVGAPTLEQQPSKYLVAQTNLFKSGKRDWPSMQVNVRNLSSKDIQDIAEYFSSQRAKSALFPTDPDPNQIALGAETAKQLNCASCHSQDFRGSKDVPRLAGQVPHYIVRQIGEFKRGARPHPLAIPPLADKLPESTIEALGAYLGKLEP